MDRMVGAAIQTVSDRARVGNLEDRRIGNGMTQRAACPTLSPFVTSMVPSLLLSLIGIPMIALALINFVVIAGSLSNDEVFPLGSAFNSILVRCWRSLVRRPVGGGSVCSCVVLLVQPAISRATVRIAILKDDLTTQGFHKECTDRAGETVAGSVPKHTSPKINRYRNISTAIFPSVSRLSPVAFWECWGTLSRSTRASDFT